ncbi:MAG: hypothetical protein VST68_11840 [Nitrospirota bacterium]|nr:hypothetical protein [Nitrospirota bacterium]
MSLTQTQAPKEALSTGKTEAPGAWSASKVHERELCKERQICEPKEPELSW